MLRVRAQLLIAVGLTGDSFPEQRAIIRDIADSRKAKDLLRGTPCVALSWGCSNMGFTSIVPLVPLYLCSVSAKGPSVHARR